MHRFILHHSGNIAKFTHLCYLLLVTSAACYWNGPTCSILLLSICLTKCLALWCLKTISFVLVKLIIILFVLLKLFRIKPTSMGLDGLPDWFIRLPLQPLPYLLHTSLTFHLTDPPYTNTVEVSPHLSCPKSTSATQFPGLPTNFNNTHSLTNNRKKHWSSPCCTLSLLTATTVTLSLINMPLDLLGQQPLLSSSYFSK